MPSYRRFPLLALVMSLLAAGPAAAAAPADWPAWGYDAARGGPPTVTLPADLHRQWTRDLGRPRRAWRRQHDDGDKLEFDLSYAPVYSGGTLFVASMTSDRLTAYEATSGEERWRFYADGPLRLAPAVADGLVYAVSDDGRLYCLDAADGRLRWRFDAAPGPQLVLGNERIISMWPARGGPVVKDGTVYFAAGIWPFLGTFVYALDARSGAVRWANTGHATEWQRQPHGGAYAFAGLAPQGYLAIAGDRLVVAGGRALPGLFDRHSGALLHHQVQLAKGSGGYRVRADDEFYYNHQLRFRLADGADAGGGDHPGETLGYLHQRAAALAAGRGETVFSALAGGGYLYYTTTDGLLHCYGPTPADQPARHPGAGPPPAPSDGAAGRAAAAVLAETGVEDGYALVIGAADVAFLEQLAVRSRLHIVALEPDPALVAAARWRLDEAGLYGRRVAVIAGDCAGTAYPRYISSLIVAADARAITDRAGLERLYQRLRPYGGQTWLAADPAAAAFQSLLAGFRPPGALISRGPGHVRLERAGALPGAGQWTHQYADAANTTFSPDERARPPFGLLWFGGPTHDNILPRHGQGPVPQVAGGRVILPGVETVSARCVYTGRELWVRRFPGIGHPFTNLELEERWQAGESVYMTNLPGANYIGSFFVSLPDGIYVRHRGGIHRLDPASGETVAVFDLGTAAGRATDPGHLSICGEIIIATVEPQFFDEEAVGGINLNATSSARLLALDRHSGQRLWEREAAVGFRHNAIASGNGRVFVIDSLTEGALDLLARRGRQPEQPPRLLALDQRTGAELWRAEEGVVGTWLSYATGSDRLVEGGRGGGKRSVPGEPYRRLAVYRGRDGVLLWQEEKPTAHLALVDGARLIPGRHEYGWMVDLETGDETSVPHPLSGEPQPWRYWRTYGCGTLNASTHLLLFRSGAAGATDLSGDGGTGTIGGFRAGCTNNLIAADGVLNAPDYTRTCTCSYQNQTSLALVHMPEMEWWTFNDPRRQMAGERGYDFNQSALGRQPPPPVAQHLAAAGINLGAPGDRRAENGTLWVHEPRRAPGPGLTVRLNTSGPAGDGARLIDARGEARQLRSGQPADCLDGDPSTGWQIRCNRSGDFDARLTFTLDRPVTLDRVAAAWRGPAGTRLRIEASADGHRWQAVHESAGAGTDGAPAVYEFAPVRADRLRLGFGAHEDTEPDRRGRQPDQSLTVSEVRLGDLPFPDAYTFFQPVDGRLFRGHALFVDDPDGYGWVSASGVDGLYELLLREVNGAGRRYTVTLHFLEPAGLPAGRRRFDVRLNGRKVAAGFDPAAAGGGPGRAARLTVGNVRLDDDLHLVLAPAADSNYPPVLSGLELKRQ